MSSYQPRLFAIGDVHGCAKELAFLLEKIDPRADDTLVFLGDYIDRGPDSRSVVEMVLACKTICKTVALKGNHEAMFVDFLERPDSTGAGLFVLNGGGSTLVSYGSNDGSFEIPDTHIRFFTSLELSYETDKFYFVHAGVPERPLSKVDPVQDEQTLLWTRNPFLVSDYKWEKLIVHGHTPVDEIERRPNRINLDTSCVYGGKLTAMEMHSGKIIEVPRDDAKLKPKFPKDSTGSGRASRIAMRFVGRMPVEAGAHPTKRFHFETLNFNPYGLLMREVNQSPEAVFKIGERIEGRIGTGNPDIKFAGVLARIESRGPERLYGIRIDRITSGSSGHEWVERPDKK